MKVLLRYFKNIRQLVVILALSWPRTTKSSGSRSWSLGLLYHTYHSIVHGPIMAKHTTRNTGTIWKETNEREANYPI